MTAVLRDSLGTGPRPPDGSRRPSGLDHRRTKPEVAVEVSVLVTAAESMERRLPGEDLPREDRGGAGTEHPVVAAAVAKFRGHVAPVGPRADPKASA
jgi:hypothetical protein